MTDTCIFCQIARAAVPAHKLIEDDLVLAFLDLHPIREGHALINSKQHHPWFEDLPESTALRIMSTGQQLARAMKREWGAERVSAFYTGIHVPPAHAHVVPMLCLCFTAMMSPRRGISKTASRNFLYPLARAA